MLRLERKHAGERALVFMGGPSVLETRMDLTRLADQGFVLFLESKALTDRFMQFGLSPDYYIMFYPEKSKSTSFQGVVLQSMIGGFDLKPLVVEERHGEIDHLLANRQQYFYSGKQNIAHKRLRWLPDVYAPGSPFELLSRLDRPSLITFRPAYEQAVHKMTFRQPTFYFDADDERDVFSLARYYSPQVADGVLRISGSRFTNSAAIAIYPLLRFMGFSKAYFVGSDMSMLGSMEHAAPFTFRTMNHFRTFFERSRRVFGAHFPSSDRKDALDDVAARIGEEGLGVLSSTAFYDSLKTFFFGSAPFLRPRREFLDIRRLMSRSPNDIEFVNVFNPYPYARPIEGMRNITFEQLLKD